MSGSRTYAQVDDFVDYTEQEVWQEYIRETVIPLWEAAWQLKEYHEKLQHEFNGRRLETLSEREQQVFLGGIDPRRDEVYRRNSVAKFYKVFFGAQVTDLQSWLLSEGGEIQTEVTVEVEESQFIEFADKIQDQLTQALSSQTLYQGWRTPEVTFGSLLRSPDEVRDIVEQLYQDVLEFVVNHSYPTFYLWSLNQTPRQFLQEAYPEFDDTQPLVRDQFGLTELDWSNPIKSDTDIHSSYEILCFPEYNPNNRGRSFGGSIVKTNEQIWSYFSDYATQSFRDVLSAYFNNVSDLKQDYEDRVANRIANVPEQWVGREFSIYFDGLSAATDRSDVEDSQESIMDLLDRAAPLLLLGLNKVTYVYDDYLKIKSIGD
ncbi:hypothetical protein ACLI4Z_19135 [Natrialbaceae archaeon A-arb3/5]